MKPLYSKIPSKINDMGNHTVTCQIGKNGALSPVLEISDSLDTDRLITGWACRSIYLDRFDVWINASFQPEPGDVAVFRVEKLGLHDRITSKDDLTLQIYKDDLFVGVFGNQFSIDAYEGVVIGSEVLHLLSPAGVVGTLLNKHEAAHYPTSVSLVGYLTTKKGCKVNLRDLNFSPKKPGLWAAYLILIIGTGTDSGIATVAKRLVKGLVSQGLRVTMSKLTGNASHADRNKLAATRAHHVSDFSDYGLPSTYLCSRLELRALFDAMLADALSVKPDYVVMELDGSVLQRENRLILDDKCLLKRVDCVVLSASCSLSALEGVRRLHWLEHKVAAVTGTMTNAPFFVREFNAQSSIPVGYLNAAGEDFALLIQNQLMAHSI